MALISEDLPPPLGARRRTASPEWTCFGRVAVGGWVCHVGVCRCGALWFGLDGWMGYVCVRSVSSSHTRTVSPKSRRSQRPSGSRRDSPSMDSNGTGPLLPPPLLRTTGGV